MERLMFVSCLFLIFGESFGGFICPDDWKLLPGDRHQCIKVFAATISWTAAKLRCQEQASNLASIHNAFENTFIAQEVRRLTLPSAWIGGVTATPAKGDITGWFWEDCTNFQSFMHWNSAEPDAAPHCGSTNSPEACSNLGQDGLWYDICCDGSIAVHGFACSQNAEDSTL